MNPISVRTMDDLEYYDYLDFYFKSGWVLFSFTSSKYVNVGGKPDLGMSDKPAFLATDASCSKISVFGKKLETHNLGCD